MQRARRKGEEAIHAPPNVRDTKNIMSLGQKTGYEIFLYPPRATLQRRLQPAEFHLCIFSVNCDTPGVVTWLIERFGISNKKKCAISSK